jgi:phosphohistidine phosphatase
MELYFLRHAAAVEPGTPGYTRDADRPLTLEGVKKMKQAARGMKRMELQPDFVVSSPYLRARQTAELAVQGLRWRSKIAFSEALVPSGSLDELEALLGGYGPNSKLLLVGHQPSLGTFISGLLTRPGDLNVDVRKGSLCCVEFSGSAARGGGVLRWFLRNRFLRALA